MSSHPTDGTLRRLLDEPFAVAVDHERHARDCGRCRRRLATLRHDADTVTGALPETTGTGFTPAPVALQRLRFEQVRRPEPAPEPATAHRPARPVGFGWRRPSLARPLAAGALAVVVVGGATAAATTNVFQVFKPQKVTPIVLQEGDGAGVAELSSFGHATGSRTTLLTPESSAAAVTRAAGLEAPSIRELPASVQGGPAYWKVGPEWAKFTVSVAKVEHAAAAHGKVASPAPAGVDGATVQVSTGAGVLELWGSVDLGSAGGSGSSTKSDVPELAVLSVKGPSVTSTGASLASIESYLLAQPEVPAGLAAQIRALGQPGSAVPLPVPHGDNQAAVTIDGHRVVEEPVGHGATVAVWSSGGRLWAVTGRISTSQLLDVVRQLA